MCSHLNRLIDSNEYTEHAIINIKKKITLNYPKYNDVCSYGIFSKGLKNETAVVNEPSVFDPLKFYCIQWNFCGMNRLRTMKISSGQR